MKTETDRPSAFLSFTIAMTLAAAILLGLSATGFATSGRIAAAASETSFTTDRDGARVLNRTVEIAFCERAAWPDIPPYCLSPNRSIRVIRY